jgi:hypothetical protein
MSESTGSEIGVNECPTITLKTLRSCGKLTSGVPVIMNVTQRNSSWRLTTRGLLALACLAAACSSSPSGGAVSGAGDSGPTDDATPTADGGAGPDGGGADGAQAVASLDDGPSRCRGATIADAGSCPSSPFSSKTIIGTMFSANGGAITFGSAPDLYDAYAFATAGQTTPSISAASAKISFSATLSRTSAVAASAGVGVSIAKAACLDASSSPGLTFSLSGTLGGCALFLDAVVTDDESRVADPCRGTCDPVANSCVAPSYELPSLATNQVPFMSFGYGIPDPIPESKQLIGFRWRLELPDDAGSSCSANLAITNVSFL